MKSNIEILSEIFEPTSFDCKTEMEDLQIAITLNPNLTKILRAMELAQEQVKLCNIPHVSNNEERVAVVCSTCKWQYAKYEYKCESCCAGDNMYEQDTDC